MLSGPVLVGTVPSGPAPPAAPQDAYRSRTSPTSLAERHEQPVDLRASQAQDHRPGAGTRVSAPGVVRDDELVARLAGPQDHDLVVRRLVRVSLGDRRLAAERADRHALEDELRVLGELLEHRSEIARADAFVEAVHV